MIGEGEHRETLIHVGQGDKDVFGEPLTSGETDHCPVPPLGRLACVGTLSGPCRKGDVILVLIPQISHPTPQVFFEIPPHARDILRVHWPHHDFTDRLRA